MDTTLALSLEINRRPEHERSPQWIARWSATLRRAVDALEQEVGSFGTQVDMNHIAVGCALAYLDLRASDHVTWRDGCPCLAAWFRAFEQRGSMQSTQPG
jgi:glutathione S-transferase